MLEISLVMIAKNEEAHIENSIKSAALFVSDIVVIDTGSADKTRSIAAAAGARVFDFLWTGDFSQARNYAAGKAKCDWLLVLDADECVTDFDINAVAAFMQTPEKRGSIFIRNLTGNEDTVFCEHMPRFYNRKYYEFEGQIHEQLVTNGETKYENIPVTVDHYGYAPNIMREKQKFERNIEMLSSVLSKNPNDTYYLYHMGKTYFVAKQYKNAVSYFEKMLAQNPNFALDYIKSGVLCFGYALINAKMYEKALCVAEYKKYYNNSVSFRFMLAHVMLNAGKISDALELFESCVGKEDDGIEGIGSYLSYYNIGVILETAGFADNARAYYRACGDYKRAKERLK